jgi:hypothetical protein
MASGDCHGAFPIGARLGRAGSRRESDNCERGAKERTTKKGVMDRHWKSPSGLSANAASVHLGEGIATLQRQRRRANVQIGAVPAVVPRASASCDRETQRSVPAPGARKDRENAGPAAVFASSEHRSTMFMDGKPGMTELGGIATFANCVDTTMFHVKQSAAVCSASNKKTGDLQAEQGIFLLFRDRYRIRASGWKYVRIAECSHGNRPDSEISPVFSCYCRRDRRIGGVTMRRTARPDTRPTPAPAPI